MSDATGLVHRTRRARELFFDQGQLPGDWLAPHISRSWTRSRGAGVRQTGPAPLRDAELQDRRTAARRLLESAQPELDALAEHAIGNGCVVIVTDAAGLILEEIGSPDFVSKAQRCALLPGVEWSETQCGTNAIGTALVERHALAVVGGEHFLPGYGGLGCAAAPIFDGRGAIAGVLDVTGDAVRIDGHTLGLVRMASQQIEHRMLLARPRGDKIRFHANPGVLGSSREGLLTVVDGQVVAANRIALGLLGQTWDSLLDRPVEQLLGSGWRAAGSDASKLVLPGGRQVIVSRHQAAGRGRAVGAARVDPERRAEPDREDASIARTLHQGVKVIDAGVPVLVTGETGVGKEVFVRRLHAASRRHRGPLVIVNCAALPDTLIEAELFGYDEGAFTGARRQGTAGRIREAHGGTLMLDEIGDMPLLLQTRLLRVLEDKVVVPLGGGRPTTVDFQLVCATHCDLAALAASGRFRADLMFRVNGYEARLPSLREREDKVVLIRKLFAEAGGEARRLALADEALDALCAHRWPGNVRELLGVLRTSIALAETGTVVGIDDLPERIARMRVRSPEIHRVESTDGGSAMALADVADQQIRNALQRAGGNVARAAMTLGVHRSTVYRHLRRSG